MTYTSKTKEITLNLCDVKSYDYKEYKHSLFTPSSEITLNMASGLNIAMKDDEAKILLKLLHDLQSNEYVISKNAITKTGLSLKKFLNK